MTLRFAILKGIGDGEDKVVLEYNEQKLLSRLQARVRENLIETETVIKRYFIKPETIVKHSFEKPEIAKALDKAFNDLVLEFKEETVKLR